MSTYLFTSLGTALLTGCAWFSLWAISFNFTLDAEMAILLFPFALRLGITLHSPKKFWPVIYMVEWLLMAGLALLLEQPQWLAVIAASAASVPFVFMAVRYYSGPQWRRLTVIGLLILSTSFINAVAVYVSGHSGSMALLSSITGGLMLVPTCYLFWSYLFERGWVPLTVNLVSQSVEFRSSHLLLYLFLFSASITAQHLLPLEMRHFAPFCLAVPIILLAYQYGWQGALLGTLLNSMVLIATRNGISHIEVTDLLLSLSAQSVIGICLGLGIQQQRDLNQKLRHQLKRNHCLSRQLVQAEEGVRQEVARELHDEIGQNITAIRMQANIIQRVDAGAMAENSAGMIESLSLNIYDTTKGLLSRLRPKALDDMGLEEAVRHLVRELEFGQQGITVAFRWMSEEDEQAIDDTVSVTIFRICQEALNNITKHANASHIKVACEYSEKLAEVALVISDDGTGFVPEEITPGYGLSGIEERVQVLGGRFSLSSREQGTELRVALPTQ